MPPGTEEPPATFKQRVGTWRQPQNWRRPQMRPGFGGSEAYRAQQAPEPYGFQPGFGGWPGPAASLTGRGGFGGGFAEGGTLSDATGGGETIDALLTRLGITDSGQRARWAPIITGGGQAGGMNLLPSLVAARMGRGLPAFQAFGAPLSEPALGIGEVPPPYAAASSWWQQPTSERQQLLDLWQFFGIDPTTSLSMISAATPGYRQSQRRGFGY